MPQKEIITSTNSVNNIDVNHTESYARKNLKNLSPVHIIILTTLIQHWQNSRNLISETNKQSPEILPILTSGEVDEAEEVMETSGNKFDGENYAKELSDVLVFLQMMTEVVGDGYSINAILAAVDKKLVLANSSNVFDKTNEIIGDITFIKNKEKADKKVIFEVYTTVLALYMSSPELPDIVVAMYKTIRFNELNYPQEYFEVDPSIYNNLELVELYNYRRALCRVLRDEGMIGKDVDSITQEKNVLIFADIVLNESLGLDLAMQLLKERISKIKQNSHEEYRILLPGESDEGDMSEINLSKLKTNLVAEEKVEILIPNPAQVLKYSAVRNA